MGLGMLQQREQIAPMGSRYGGLGQIFPTQTPTAAVSAPQPTAATTQQQSPYGSNFAWSDMGDTTDQNNPWRDSYGPAESALRSLGYTGALTSDNYMGQKPTGENGVMTDYWESGMNPALTDWLKQNNYSIKGSYGAPGVGSGAGGEIYGGVFDQSGALKGMGSQGYSNSAGWIDPVVKLALGAMLGGAASGALGGAGAGELGGTAGASGAEQSFLNSALSDSALGGGGDALAGAAGMGAGEEGAGQTLFNPAMDSQAANLGGADVWGAAGNGATGAGVATGAPGSVNLGGLGGVLTTGAGASAVPSIFNQAQDSQQANQNMGAQPGATPGEIGSAMGNPAIPTGTGTGGGLGDLFSKMPGGLSSVLQKLTSGQGLGGLLGMYNANQQNNMLKDQMANLDRMFATDSPYAKQMQETLARKDAAAGRNSQYGPRAEKLAADLTSKKADMTKDMLGIYDRMSVNKDSSIRDLASIFGGNNNGQSVFSGLSSGFQDLMKLIGG